MAKTAQEKKLFEVLKQIGRTPEEQARLSHTAFMSVDRALVYAVAEKYGADKALEIHRKKWLYLTQGAFETAKKELELGKVKDLPALGRVVRYLHDLIPCPYKIVVDTPHRIVGLVIACPFFDMGRLVYGEKYGSTWFKALANTSGWFMKRVTELAGLDDKVHVEQDKYMCLNEKDEVCRMTFERLNRKQAT